jgi:hypothetical protein
MLAAISIPIYFLASDAVSSIFAPPALMSFPAPSIVLQAVKAIVANVINTNVVSFFIIVILVKLKDFLSCIHFTRYFLFINEAQSESVVGMR